MRRAFLLLAILVGCGDNGHGGGGAPDASGGVPDGPPGAIDAMSADANPNMPATLADTGLCLDAACTQISPDVFEFAPDYTLWADGATKRRWIYLPPGTQIDTSDMDYWSFPAGTKIWKEFTVDGTRVETRLIQKNGPDPADWYMVAYAWNAAQDQAVAVPNGASNVLGTQHDIPSSTKCHRCHEGMPDRVIGFSAILLDHDGMLDQVIGKGWLSNPPQGTAPYFPLPGDAAAQAALGYLHANCGNCHNPQSYVASMVSVDWRLRVGLLGDVTQTPAYTSAVNVPATLGIGGATYIIQPMNPSLSAAYLRLTSTSPATMMPPIGHETVDPDGSAQLAAWIDELQ